MCLQPFFAQAVAKIAIASHCNRRLQRLAMAIHPPWVVVVKWWVVGVGGWRGPGQVAPPTHPAPRGEELGEPGEKEAHRPLSRKLQSSSKGLGPARSPDIVRVNKIISAKPNR